MRIYMITDRIGAPDEGMKGTASGLYSEVSKSNDVRCVSPREVLSLSFINDVRMSKPDIIHYLPGPTILSFILLKLASEIAGSFSVASVTHPKLPRRGLGLIRFLWPDLVLCQSNATRALLSSQGLRTDILWSGVDTTKFSPVDCERKIELRKGYGIDKDAFVALHVGHVNTRRNLEGLVPIAGMRGVRVLIVASNSSKPDMKLKQGLLDAGCIIRSEYTKSIEDTYRMADCYIFPTSDPRGCIELPLSVLEALSCNLPIITTRFGAIPDLFAGKEGVFFFESQDDLVECIDNVRTSNRSWNTRQYVLDLDWTQIGNRLEGLYTKHLSQNGAI